MLFKYLKHFFTAKGPDRVHSPFVFDLYYHTLRGNLSPYGFLETEIAFGIVKSTKTEKFCIQTIYKLINIFKPKTTLCLGSESLRIAHHIAKINQNQIIYFDNDSIANKPPLSNVREAKSIEALAPEAIIISSETVIEKINFSNAFLLIVTDLYEPAQYELWKKICLDNRFNISIDCFFTGICFYRPNQEKEYFKLRF